MGANGWLPPPGIELNPEGRYAVRCPLCRVVRWLLWHGPSTARSQQAQKCRSCASRIEGLLKNFVGAYVEPDPDPVVVGLLVRGGDPKLQSLPGERRLAAAELWRRYPWLTTREVAERFNVSMRTVERYRSQLRISQRAAA